MEKPLGESSLPASRPSEPAPDRATPIVDPALDYAAYIGATETRAPARETVRIRESDLDALVDQSKGTGSIRVPGAFASALDRAARRGLEASAQRARRSRRGALAVLGGVVVTAAGAALWLWSPHARVGPGRASTGAPASAQGTGAPASAPAPADAPAPSAMPAVVGPDLIAPARRALERLRDGLGACIVHGIHGLPGSSPPVPAALPSAKGAGALASPGDWRTPVWSCARFRISEPMLYQLQWQLVRPGVEGMGVAWVDADGDGAADAALGFRVGFGPKGELEIGDVGPVEASRPVLPVR